MFSPVTTYITKKSHAIHKSTAEVFSDRLVNNHANGARYSDFIVHCNGYSWAAHRVILSAHSTFFDKLCSSDFKARQESQERAAHLDDDDAIEVQLMMEFFYSHTYTHPTLPDGGDNATDTSMETHARMYNLGDKYGCTDLKRYAYACLTKKASCDADVYNSTFSSKDWHEARAEDLAATAAYVYGHPAPCNRRLRKALVKMQAGDDRPPGVYLCPTTLKTPRWLDIAKQVPEFVADLLNYIAGTSDRHDAWLRRDGSREDESESDEN